MQSVRPDSIEYIPTLVCPHCGWSYNYLSFRDLRAQNWRIRCGCDKTFKVERVQSVEIFYKSGSEVSWGDKKVRENHKSTNQPSPACINRDDVVTALVNLGYKRREAQIIVHQMVENGFSGTDEELVTEIVQTMRK